MNFLMPRYLRMSVAVMAGMLGVACVSGSGAVISDQALPPPSPLGWVNPGDVLRITVWRSAELSGEFKVAEDSTLAHPLYRAVRVGGLPLPVAEEHLGTFLRTYMQDLQVSIELLHSVAVLGDVRSPAIYSLPPATTVAQAIAHAGGPGPTARLDRVHITRGNTRLTINMKGAAERNGNIRVRSGDRIFVQARGTSSFFRDVLAPLTQVLSLAASTITLVIAINNLGGN